MTLSPADEETNDASAEIMPGTDIHNDTSPSKSPRGIPWVKIGVGLLLLTATGLGLFFAGQYLSLDDLAQRETAIHTWVDNHRWQSYLIALGLYVFLAGLSVPIGGPLSLGLRLAARVLAGARDRQFRVNRRGDHRVPGQSLSVSRSGRADAGRPSGRDPRTVGP